MSEREKEMRVMSKGDKNLMTKGFDINFYLTVHE